MEKHEETDLVRWMREWKCIAECCNGNFVVRKLNENSGKIQVELPPSICIKWKRTQ